MANSVAKLIFVLGLMCPLPLSIVSLKGSSSSKVSGAYGTALFARVCSSIELACKIDCSNCKPTVCTYTASFA